MSRSQKVRPGHMSEPTAPIQAAPKAYELHKLANKERDARAALKPGDRVCIVGFGTANPVHRHATVTGMTKLYVKTEYKNKSGDAVQHRHRIDDGHSTPRGDGYGGTTLRTTCQRPKPKKETP